MTAICMITEDRGEM